MGAQAKQPSTLHSSLTFALQALLSRHESYLAESEAERIRLTSSISSLEAEKTSLQDANQELVKQNRDLLDKLEGLNTTLSDSDDHVKNLEALLVSAELEVRRLNGLAGRAEELEDQLRQLERENLKAREQIVIHKQEERTALSRWREAEMKVRDMAREVERIESEARKESEAHLEVVKRMDREAAGRIKGTAALKEGDGNRNVVSHFVRDILQDNANLQAGIVELRELLQTSNDEVQGLREQIVQHQPVSPSDENVPGIVGTLDDQMGWSTPKQVSQEVHVHHHYHAKFAASTKRIQPRRNTRKRGSAGLLGTTPDSSVTSTPTARPQRHVSSPHMPALSIDPPQPRVNRWSMQSAATGSSNLSSIPNSPRSYFDHRNMSIFDRLEEDNESSRPTSPESACYASPKQYRANFGHRAGRPSDFSTTSFAIHEDGSLESSPTNADGKDLAVDASVNGSAQADSLPSDPIPDTGQSQDVHDLEPDDSYLDDRESHRTLRRTTSHESLVSISGMDIHLAKRKPSQVFVLTHGISTAPSPSRSLSANQPLASIAEVSATSSQRSFSSDQSSASLALLKQAGHVPSPSQQLPRGLGQLVGGWVRGNWGIAPMRSTQDLRSQAQTQSIPQPARKASDASSETVSSPKTISHQRKRTGSALGDTPFGGISRPMGINQSGPIPGFVIKRTPSEVHAKVLDQGLLREALWE
jgi:hypothetical protein